MPYGICPSCLNPIRLIGLECESKQRPYGKHAGETIQGLPVWKKQRYEYCPFASKNDRRAPNEDDLLPEIDDGVIELYELLRKEFDRVVYLLQKELHIRCSDVFWRRALHQFVVNRVYCYPWLTESNLPYIFALRGLQQSNCYGQKFEVDTDLYRALGNHPAVQFEDVRTHTDEIDPKYKRLRQKQGRFLKLVFRLTEHKQIAEDGHTLKETMKFCVDDNLTGQTIHEETIEFDESYFTNLISAANSERYRVQKYLDMANECMPPLELTDNN